jgi:hypothetical protein
MPEALLRLSASVFLCGRAGRDDQCAASKRA